MSEKKLIKEQIIKAIEELEKNTQPSPLLITHYLKAIDERYKALTCHQ